MQEPEIHAFPVALDLVGRGVLVIGGDDEAEHKARRLLQAGARVTIVAPFVTEDLAQAARAGRLRWFAREFTPSDAQGAHLVLLTTPDAERAAELRALARRARFLLCAIDQPAYSDFFLVSVVAQGPVQLAISTSGRAPLLARRLRQALAHALDARFAEFARGFAELRARVRTLPKPARREVLERALTGFAMEVRLSYPDSDGHADLPSSEVREQ